MKKNCGKCGTENHRPAKKCVKCGAPFGTGKKRAKRKVDEQSLGAEVQKVAFAAGISSEGSLVLMWPARGELIALTPAQTRDVERALRALPTAPLSLPAPSGS